MYDLAMTTTTQYTFSPRKAREAKAAGARVVPCEGLDDNGDDVPAWEISYTTPVVVVLGVGSDET